MARRALRPSFVVTFALGAVANACGCSGGSTHGNPGLDGSIGDASINDSPIGDDSIADGSIGDDSNDGASMGDGSTGDGSTADAPVDCGNYPPGDGSTGSPGCPAEQPPVGAPCCLPSWAQCSYGGPYCTSSNVTVSCLSGTWSPVTCNNPPAPEAGPDASDGGADGHGQDGGPD